jgi:tetratricopeptide (TPR) repeat protein
MPILRRLTRRTPGSADGALRSKRRRSSSLRSGRTFNDDGRAEASRFLDLLTGALQQDLRVIVILAIRSDSFPSLQNEAKLASVAKVPFDLPPLPATSMRLVIEGPAQVAQPPITLDPQLVEALLEDAQGADTLPLLAFTLGRLQQDFGAEGKLMLGHYERLGRISGAVNAAVADALTEGVRRGLLPSDKVQLDDLLRETFIPHLARVNNAGQFVRHVATKADLSPRSQGVVDLFVEARLLLRDRRPTPSGDDDIVEVAHEALLRKWPALNSWLEADREFLIGKEQLVQDIANWRDANEEQKDEALLSGLNLTRARQWIVERRTLDLSAEEREYIGASITRANAQARRRRWLVGATVGVLVTIGVVLGLVDRNRRDADARAQAGAQLLVQLVTTKLIHIQGLQVNTLDAILTASKSTFDELVSAVGDQPAFQQYRAELMSGFGANYLKVKDGLDKANDAYGEALRSTVSLPPGTPAPSHGNADRRSDRQHRVVLQQQGKIELALQNFRQSLALRQPIGAREPNDPISYRDVASSEYNIGEIMMQFHRAQESLDSDRAALDQIKKALSLDPNNHALELKLSLILVSMGVAYQALGLPKEHRQANQEALAIRKQLHEVQPDNPEWSRYLAWSYFWVGNDYLDNDDALEALKNHEQCLLRGKHWQIQMVATLSPNMILPGRIMQSDLHIRP